uniref:STEEP1 domain-containing protein n=1 Tax=Mycena chlorophos TaxID=658473 RepID=A0ABQ0M9E6_MYCCL|nr:predicted protein [Mycena chlorophos]
MPKVVSRSQISRFLRRPMKLTRTTRLPPDCICGEFNLVIDKTLAALPRRKTDNAVIIQTQDTEHGNARVFKLNAVAATEPMVFERPGGYERRYNFSCPRCTLPVAYQTTPPPVKSAPYLYILPGALSHAQGQLPPDAFDREEPEVGDARDLLSTLMSLPSARELELESLVRQRDTQLAALKDEITRLRRSIAAQPTPTDPVSLPTPLTALLIPHLASASASSAPSSSGTSALTQRTRLLQEENDELYDLLRNSETGKLKEEVRGLRRVVDRLEGALRESHQVVQSLSTELDKTHEALLATRPRSPRASTSNSAPPPAVPASAAKQPPTGPRAHKKPRISETQQLPRGPAAAANNSNSHNSPQKARNNHNNNHFNNSHNMDVDEKLPPSRPRGGRDRDRDRERSRNNGRGGGRRGGTPMSMAAESSSGGNADRTLKERLGL